MNVFVGTGYNDPLVHPEVEYKRKAQSVRLEIGVGSSEVELHIQNRSLGFDR